MGGKVMLLFVLCFFFVRETEGGCGSNSDCGSCTTSRSWIGSCRWCPDTNSCHATGSRLNRCSREDNIKSPSACSSTGRDRKTESSSTRRERVRCRTHSDCKTCTDNRSWLGPCRWCPDTETCHATGSLVNRCAQRDNIKTPSACSSIERKPEPTKQTKRITCQTHSDCKTCTSNRSWLGPCRWCPDTKSCHETGSLLNRCTLNGNIRTPEDCLCPTDSINHEKENYSPEKAQKLARLSKIAYSNESLVRNEMMAMNYKRIYTVFKRCPGQIINNFRCGGFSAVSEEEKMIVVVFRGSQGAFHVLQQIIKGRSLNSFPAGGLVLKYFNDVFELIWPRLRKHIYQLIKDYSGYRVYVTGHSLGGALASLVSTAIAHECAALKTSIVLYTFGQPRTGNHLYAKAHDDLVKASWRIVNYEDVVPHVPPCKTENEPPKCTKSDMSYYHHGTEIFCQRNSCKSDYKKCLGLPEKEDITCSNSLYLDIDIVKQLLSTDSRRNLTEKLVRGKDDHLYYFGIYF